jgi:hypothetical protein
MNASTLAPYSVQDSPDSDTPCEFDTIHESGEFGCDAIFNRKPAQLQDSRCDVIATTALEDQSSCSVLYELEQSNRAAR